MRRAALALLCALVAGCGGGDDARTRVRDYIVAANGVQERLRPELKRTNDAYVAFSRGKLSPDDAVTRLRAGERATVRARAAIGALRPPREASGLDARLRRVYAMNVAFAHQTTLLATYQRGAAQALAPLARDNRRLRAALRRFAGELSRALRRLRALEVPAVLGVSHRDQIRRLDATRVLSVRLRRALEANDAKGVARLLRRFRRTAPDRRPRRALARRAIADYQRRYRQLNDAYADVSRENVRLNRTLD
ncbi:MAG TPA: hypothetical protein VFG79_24965 [Solirubrobacter sp.]|nr:hypothetical protein [Solirubrobacter sp.]